MAAVAMFHKFSNPSNSQNARSLQRVDMQNLLRFILWFESLDFCGQAFVARIGRVRHEVDDELLDM
eukprot:6263322-Amphidinium_carterae.2